MPITRRMHVSSYVKVPGAEGNTTHTDPPSQRNRASRRGGQLLEYIGLPALRAPGASVPDGRTIGRTPKNQARDGGADIFIPVTNPIERLHAEIKRRTNGAGIFPSENAITRLVGAFLLEQNDEWAVSRRYKGLESIAPVSDNLTGRLPAVAA